MNLDVCPKGVFKKLLCLIVVLLCLNILGLISRFYFDHDYVYRLVPLFNLNTERSIPTFYSAVALLSSSGLLFFITFIHKNNGCNYLGWLGLSIIFMFLSVDEITSIHESLGPILRGSFSVSGFLYFAWVIPYGLALIIFFVTYLKFLLRLPKNIMMLFVVSGGVFILGAIGVESFGGRHYELYGNANITYALLYTLEEFLEMLGIALFIYTLLTYIEGEFGSIMITTNQSSLEKLDT
jgi:hypothetical protein